MQAGEEWARTKYGDHSNKGPLSTNRLDWARRPPPEFAALTAFTAVCWPSAAPTRA